MSTRGPRVSRRQVLALAAAGAGGAAAFRVFGLHLGEPSLISRPGPNGAWDSPLGQPRALAAHLLRRAGFGYSSADLDKAASMSYTDLVDSIVNQQPAPLPIPANVGDYRSVAQAWLQRMAQGPAQFPERMAFFWHGHLTSDFRKANRLPFVYVQNETYRSKGLGDLRTLLLSTTTDPLMMRYLDLDQSTGSAPNENYSRELMELYTLGAGNFTEDDVRAGARALAGLRIGAFDASGNRIRMPRPKGAAASANRQQVLQAYYAQLARIIQNGGTFRGEIDPARTYSGSVTFLGRTGTLTGSDVIDTILAKPQAATFIATAALTYFATASPSADLVNRVADAFRSSQYDIKTMMRTIFLSDEFRGGAAYRSLVRSPIDLMVATMRATGADLVTQSMQAAEGMGQMLYDPPTVAGWPSNGAWLSSSSVLARINFASTVATGFDNLPDPIQAVRDQLDGTVGPDLAAVFNAAGNDGGRWYALLASPEFNLK